MAKITLKKTYETIENDYTILVDGKTLASRKYPNLESNITFRKYESNKGYCCEVHLMYGEKNIDSICVPTKEGDEQKVIKMLRPIIKYAIENILSK